MNTKLILFFLILSSQLFSIPKWLDEVDLYPNENYISMKADCIIFLNEEETIIKNAETATITTKIAFKVLNLDGKQYARIAYESNKKDKCSIKGWRFTKDKEWVNLSKTSIYETSLSGYGFYYDDALTKQATFQNIVPGDIIVYEIERTVKNWSVTYQSFVFQDDQPTLNTKYSITIPEGWELEKEEMNLESFNSYNENNTYVWEGENLSFQEYEPYSVDWDYLVRSIKLVAIDPEEKKYSFKNWDNISKWYTQECSDKLEKTSSIKEKTSEIIAGASSNFEKSEKIADFVKAEIRYVAIEIGKNAIVPRPAFKTMENGFGDCKDKAILMISMLSEIGVEAYPVLVSTNSPVQQTLPTPFQFNHCIVGIPAGQFESEVQAIGSPEILYFDPTAENSLFGNTVNHLHAENVLICTEESDLNIVNLPLQNPSNNKKKFISDGEIDEYGSFSATCKIVYLNNQMSSANYWLKNSSKEDLIEGLMNPINDILKKVDITNVEKEIFADSIVVTYQIAGNGIVRTSNPYQVIYPNIYARRYPLRLHNEERITPLLFSDYKDYTYQINWKIPEAWELNEEIFHNDSKCEGESIDMDVQIDRNSISVMLRLISMGKEIPNSDYISAQEYEKEKKQILNYTLIIPYTGAEND